MKTRKKKDSSNEYRGNERAKVEAEWTVQEQEPVEVTGEVKTNV